MARLGVILQVIIVVMLAIVIALVVYYGTSSPKPVKSHMPPRSSLVHVYLSHLPQALGA